MSAPELQRIMAETSEEVQECMQLLLPRTSQAEGRLHDAMRHGVMSGGKRLRPLMLLESARLCGVGRSSALRVAAAIEFLHCYSLIHDDLPAMDDADLRRGQLSVHRAFDEATAILAGDALLTLAFEVLADPDTHEDPKVRIELVGAMARAAGPLGMVGGQMLDMIAEHETLDTPAITRLQRLKTGALIAFCCEAGAILGKADPAHRHALKAYAHDVGLAFQIADDILDTVGRPEEIGKPVKQDRAQGKATFVSVLGLDRARAQAELLVGQACRHLEIFGHGTNVLRDIARFVIERQA